jgi:TM2 domain-containing membrane protein YozV
LANTTTPTALQPVAAIAGWIFPGLGHIVSGNARRGVAAMIGVLLLFICGLLVGGLDCVDRKEDRLWFIGQAGCGPITFAADWANSAFLKSGSAAPMLPVPRSMIDPNAPTQVSAFKGLAHANEFGTFLIFLAGLMNFCVLLDALVREPRSDGPTSGRRANDAASTAGGAR